jgi:hypothetical protein
MHEDSPFRPQRTFPALLMERLMNNSITTRVVALVCSILVTFASVYLTAGYAYPDALAILLASSTR